MFTRIAPHAAEPAQPMVGFQGHRLAGFAASTYNAENRTIEAVLSAGSPVRRFYFTEELEISRSAVDLARVESGLVCLLDTHNQNEVGAVLGAVSQVRIVDGRLLGLLTFGETPRAREVEGMVARGELRGVSIGYKVNTWDIQKTDDDGHETWRATRWELLEVSLVSVPADALAGVRSEGGEMAGIAIEENEMLTRSAPATPAPPAAPSPASPPAGGARMNSTEALDFVDAARQYGLERRAAELVHQNERGEIGADVARITLLREAGELQRAETAPARGGPRADATFDNPNFHGRAIEDAIFARLTGRAPSEAARQFMGLTMPQMAADLALRNGVRDVHRMAPRDVIAAASWNRGQPGREAAFGGRAVSHTTSDFPSLLTGAGQRYLLEMFAAASSPLKLLSRERTARDFRPISALQLSGFGTLPETLEGAEVKHGTFKERKQSYRVRKYNKQFGLSIEAIVNDDLGAFSTPMIVMARSAAETEAQILADLINDNPNLSDGKALFHADHGNLADAGAAPDVTTLAAGRLAMRSQKDDDGETPLATAPKFIVASPKRETAIEQLLVATTVPTTSNDANPFQGKLSPLIDPRLDADPWFLFSDPLLAPVLEHAYLDGFHGPQMRQREGWDILGQEFRVDLMFGAGIVDHRGGYKNAGA